MNLLLVSSAYPNENDLYKNSFVHRRVKNYIDAGHTVKVFVSSKKIKNSYNFDGVSVVCGDIKEYSKFCMYYKPDCILVHFVQGYMMKLYTQQSKSIPILIWVHGSEALCWHRRLFDFKDISFIKYIIKNTIQMYRLKKFIRKNEDIHWIFVSNWMRRIMEKDTFSNVKKSSIIPNVVDSNIFTYSEKNAEDRYKILMIRPFKSKKYATDIAIKAIILLSKTSDFNKYQITIIGEGPYFEKTIKPLRGLENIKIINKFLKQEDIKKQHDLHGVFLCPTRQDSQGVSMCEAMSSGLVPISSINTAIPEFVTNKQSGLLSDNTPEDVAKCILYLANNPEKFRVISKNASKKIQEKCGNEVVIKRELELIEMYKKN